MGHSTQVPAQGHDECIGILRQESSPTRAKIFRTCAILNTRSIASVGMMSVCRLRGGGLSSKRPDSKEFGAFCFGKKVNNQVSPNLPGHHGDA